MLLNLSGGATGSGCHAERCLIVSYTHGFFWGGAVFLRGGVGGSASIQSGGVPNELIPVFCTHNRLRMTVTQMKKLFSP